MNNRILNMVVAVISSLTLALFTALPAMAAPVEHDVNVVTGEMYCFYDEFGFYGKPQHLCGVTFSFFHSEGDALWRYQLNGTAESMSESNWGMWVPNSGRWTDWGLHNDDNFNVWFPWVPGAQVSGVLDMKYKGTEYGSGHLSQRIFFGGTMPAIP